MKAEVVTHRRWLHGAAAGVIHGLLVAVLVWSGAADAADDPRELEFHRVHVPDGRIGDVPLGGERYVPMSLPDFDAAVARVTAAAGAGQTARPRPAAAAARYEATIDSRGRLVGTVACDVSEATVAFAKTMPLGSLAVSHATHDGREAIVFGTAAGGLALRVPEAGTYTLEFSCPAADADVYRLPLVPSLASSLLLRLPAASRPVLSGAAARHAVVTPPDPTAAESGWRIDCGPAADIVITLVPRDRPAPLAALWAEIGLRAAEAAVTAAVVPTTAWQPGELLLEKDPALLVTAVTVVGDDETLASREAADGRDLLVTLPSWLDGRNSPLVVHGVAPAIGTRWQLPLLRVPDRLWAGGGMRVQVDPHFAVADIDTRHCEVVAPPIAARWPLPESRVDAAIRSDSGDTPSRAAVFHLELESSAAMAELKLRASQPTLDVTRVTTVEISPGAVIGRAACDLRVVDGEAFDIVAQVAPGWIIDAVDAAAGMVSGTAALPGDVPLDWRVAKTPTGSVLRIGLSSGAVPGAGLRVRVAGHRPPLRAGAAFGTDDIDMVRFGGESPGSAVIDFKMGPDAVLEVGGEAVGWIPVQGRLARLVEEGTLRGRIPAGDHAPNREARIVQRRPPLDAAVRVHLEPRGDQLVQSFTFRCRAEAGGIDAVVVNFSEPIGADLVWSVTAPADVAVAGRRLDRPVGRPASRQGAVAESWLVECSPAVSGPVTLRAVRTVGFTGAVAVPLAWVEGATQPRGTVTVGGSGQLRPRLRSHRLRELPAAPAGGSDVEYAYGPPQAGGGMLAAELVPARAGTDARAWAWEERVACWCHESGDTEYEARFVIENHGRDAVSLTVPAGWSVDHVLVNGVRIAEEAPGPAGGTLRVPLAASSGRLELVVKAAAVHRPLFGAWLIDPVSCMIDVPVMDRSVRLLLPPGLEVATAVGYRSTDALPRGWAERLLGVGSWPTAAPETTPDSAADAGFRPFGFAFTSDRLSGNGIVVVPRGLLTSGVIVAATLAATLAFFSVGRAAGAAFTLCIATAVAALWATAPFDRIGCVAWWAALAGIAWGTLCRRWPKRSWQRAAVCLLAGGTIGAAPPSRAADEVRPAAAARPDGRSGEPLRVFVTADEDGGMALVPEPLFRALADVTPGESAAIRVLECRVIAANPRGSDRAAPWRMVLDVDADAGGSLMIDQSSSGAVWDVREDAEGPRGIRVQAEGRILRLTAAAAGRQRVELAVRPTVVAAGPVQTATIVVPPAAVATLEAEPGPAAGPPVCDRAGDDGPFVTAVRAAGPGRELRFDISAASRVRLVWPSDPARRLVAEVRVADSVNEISWGEEACRVTATFDVDVGTEILRSLVVRADERLLIVDAAADGGRSAGVERLGARRLLVEFSPPATGRMRLELVGRMPLTDPVGVFDVPGIWLEAAGADSRSQRLVATGELEATLDAGAAEPGGSQQQRLTVRRRRQEPRGAQQLLVDFAPDQIGLSLRAQIEATAVALTRIPLQVPIGCTVERIALVEDDPEILDAAARRPVAIVWSQAAPDRVVATVQQPRAGRFGLEVDARWPIRPAARGRLPLLRAQLGGGIPVVVTWQGQPGTQPVVAGAAGNSADVVDGGPGPEYTLSPVDAPGSDEPDEPRSAAAQPDRTAAVGSRVETADVFVAFDGRGRIHGVARLDFTTRDAVVRLRLPAGMRLFDLQVDGRDVEAVPRSIGVWEVALDQVRWPRTMLVVFAGDVGPGLSAGEPLRLGAPHLEGMPARQVWWTLRPPAGSALRVAEPARRLDAAGLEAGRAAARRRLDESFAAALATTGPAERERLEEFAALRRRGEFMPGEQTWVEAVGWAGAPSEDARLVVCEAIAADGGVTLRASRTGDPTARARAAATGLVLLVSGAVWIVSAGRRRRPPPAALPAGEPPPLPSDSTASMPRAGA